MKLELRLIKSTDVNCKIVTKVLNNETGLIDSTETQSLDVSQVPNLKTFLLDKEIETGSASFWVCNEIPGTFCCIEVPAERPTQKPFLSKPAAYEADWPFGEGVVLIPDSIKAEIQNILI